mmetsp:Transcript_27898/g.67877  ORF Transcript_27898/g.67877 Transcript_27898/m.67877 type:complete len:89 (+) Transcript_27898:253-519(+)
MISWCYVVVDVCKLPHDVVDVAINLLDRSLPDLQLRVVIESTGNQNPKRLLSVSTGHNDMSIHCFKGVFYPVLDTGIATANFPRRFSR